MYLERMTCMHMVDDIWHVVISARLRSDARDDGVGGLRQRRLRSCAIAFRTSLAQTDVEHVHVRCRVALLTSAQDVRSLPMAIRVCVHYAYLTPRREVYSIGTWVNVSPRSMQCSLRVSSNVSCVLTT